METMSESDDLFVIDKKGENEKSVQSDVIYFATQGQLGDKPSEEAKNTEQNPRKRKGPVHAKRYHETDDYSDFRPGKLSKELRGALNLGKYDIPFHIYRMRSLGYPPGWLKKARVGDGLTIFDSAVEYAKGEMVTYNREALIKYPGFNEKLDYRSIDHCVYLNCRPMQNHHMLDNFFAALTQSSDCDVERHTDESDDELCRLRAERERILNEIRRLDSKTSVSEEPDNNDKKMVNQADPPCSNTDDADVVGLVSTPSTGLAALGDGEPEEVLAANTSENGTYTPNQSLSLDTSQIGEDGKACSTPIPPPKRPSIEAFTVGVQPYRPFDNLPGSQGTYQRVLKTLRDSVAKANSRDASGQESTSKKASPLRSSDHPRTSSGDSRSGHLLPAPVDSFRLPRSQEWSFGHSPRRPGVPMFHPGDRRPALLPPPGDAGGYRTGYPQNRHQWR